MARLMRLPGLASVLLVTNAREIDDLIAHPALARSFAAEGPLVNRMLARAISRQTSHNGAPLAAFLPEKDPVRVASQRELFARLDKFASVSAWPPAPVIEMARFVVSGGDAKSARAALAYAIAWPFMGLSPAAPHDDAYKPVGRHLWRLHRRTVRARSMLFGPLLRLLGMDRRARAVILEKTGDDPYGLHAVEITLANADLILTHMRRVFENRRPDMEISPRELAWAAIRTAPELVVRQTGAAPTTLPHETRRIPPHTLVFLRMRESLAGDTPSGFEFASRHWSACPAQRYVMGLFAAVAEKAIERAAGGGRI